MKANTSWAGRHTTAPTAVDVTSPPVDKRQRPLQFPIVPNLPSDIANLLMILMAHPATGHIQMSLPAKTNSGLRE